MTHEQFKDESEAREALELIVDVWCLESVIAMLSDICDEKAAHIRESYNDSVTAHEWKKASDRLTKLAPFSV